ncbi:hypothetical protein RFI_12722, partial [Reticulomyxa filosa]
EHLQQTRDVVQKEYDNLSDQLTTLQNTLKEEKIALSSLQSENYDLKQKEATGLNELEETNKDIAKLEKQIDEKKIGLEKKNRKSVTEESKNDVKGSTADQRPLLSSNQESRPDTPLIGRGDGGAKCGCNIL